MPTDPVRGAIDFDWIIEGRLGAFSASALSSLLALRELGIRAIVSLTEHAPDALQGAAKFRWLHLPMADMTPPTVEQTREFVSFVDSALADGLPIGVHCLAGLGRTGTLIACYLVSQGERPTEAIRRVRVARPGSIQTEEQERFVVRWAMVDRGSCPSGRFL